MKRPQVAEHLPLALLAGLLLCAAASAGDQGAPQQASPSVQGLAGQVGDALTAHGWIRAEGEDGSIVYRTPAVPERPADEADARVAQPAGQEAAPDTLADRLRRTLEAQGWTAVPAEDGSVSYLPPAPEPAPPPAAGGGLAERMRQMLEARGWTAAPAEDGSVYYLPPETATEPEQGHEPAPGPTLAERLREQLEAQGWEHSVSEDGSLVFRSPDMAEQAKGAAGEASSPAPAGSLADRMRQALEARGWKAAPAEDGSVYYLPPEPAMESGQAQQPAPGSTLADRLRRTLEARGWTAASDGKGGVYYLPPEPPAATGAGAEPGATPGEPAAQASPAKVMQGQETGTGHGAGGPPPAPPGPDGASGQQEATPEPPAAEPPSAPSSPAETRGPAPSRLGWGNPAQAPRWSPPTARHYMPYSAWQPVQPQSPPAWRPSPWGGPPTGAYRYYR